jgi:hypothetical protein
VFQAIKMGANAIYGDFLAENIISNITKEFVKKKTPPIMKKLNCTENSYSFANEPGKLIR